MRDVFGKPIADGTTAVLSISSSNPYNPERLRLEVDGTLAQPEYGSIPQYTHTGKVHRLIPGAGETVTLRSAERPFYVVQYEFAASFAVQANKTAAELEGDDRIRYGLYDGTDGWCIEFNSGHSENEADLVIMRGGSVVRRKTDVNVRATLDSFRRILVRGAWYDTTRHEWTISYSVDGEQVNSEIGSYGMAGDGPNTPQLPIQMEVRADASTSDLELDAGSMGFAHLGDAAETVRTKEITLQSSVTQTGDYEPLYAFRKDPSRSDINVEAQKVEILNYGSGELFEVSLQLFAPSKVGFSGNDSWGVLPAWSETNNALQERDDVNSIPDSTGATDATQTNPGGLQLSYHSYLGGKQNDPAVGSTTGERRKANLTEDKIAVLLGRVVSGGTPADTSVYLKFAQAW